MIREDDQRDRRLAKLLQITITTIERNKSNPIFFAQITGTLFHDCNHD